jgi:hypothetical protein
LLSPSLRVADGKLLIENQLYAVDRDVTAAEFPIRHKPTGRTCAKNGWGVATPNRSIGGGPLRIDETTYQRGLGTHANAVSVYHIPENATRFVAGDVRQVAPQMGLQSRIELALQATAPGGGRC